MPPPTERGSPPRLRTVVGSVVPWRARSAFAAHRRRDPRRLSSAGGAVPPLQSHADCRPGGRDLAARAADPHHPPGALLRQVREEMPPLVPDREAVVGDERSFVDTCKAAFADEAEKWAIVALRMKCARGVVASPPSLHQSFCPIGTQKQFVGSINQFDRPCLH